MSDGRIEVPRLILAPLRGVTGRCFRRTFAAEIAAAGFAEAFTPFITVNAGVDPLKNEELRMKNEGRSYDLRSTDSRLNGNDERIQSKIENRLVENAHSSFRLTPQVIGKDPKALRVALERIREAGFETADLNCGCPFPMVRNKGRGSGLLRTPDVLRQMLEAGCLVMGEGRFSLKARLGVERSDELLKLMPMINCFPLRCLTVHARTAKQMYEGACDRSAFEAVRAVAEMPVVYNGDVGQTQLGRLHCDEEGEGGTGADGDVGQARLGRLHCDEGGVGGAGADGDVGQAQLGRLHCDRGGGGGGGGGGGPMAMSAKHSLAVSTATGGEQGERGPMVMSAKHSLAVSTATRGEYGGRGPTAMSAKHSLAVSTAMRGKQGGRGPMVMSAKHSLAVATAMR